MFKVLILPFFFAAVTIPASPQARGGTGGGSRPPSVPTRSTSIPSDPTSMTGAFFISGKVMVDDGTLLTDHPAIKSLCNGRTRVETYADSKGHFSFEVKTTNQHASVVSEDASDSSQSDFGQATSQMGMGSSNTVGSYMRNCQLQASLPGFTSATIELASKVSDVGTTDVGTLVLHRMAQVEGLTLSVTSAQAPSKAKKAYDKGRDEAKKEKWDAAQESFQKAVAEYPQYAVAWYELGRVQLKKGNSEAGRKSFQQAISADAKFVSPYHELAALAVHEQKWQEAVDSSSQLLKLNPVDFVGDWLVNAAANYNLQNYEAAATSAARGVDLDKQHQFPTLEHLLGLALAQKHDYAGAAEHFHSYLRVSPHAADAELVQKQADEMERLAQETTAGK